MFNASLNFIFATFPSNFFAMFFQLSQKRFRAPHWSYLILITARESNECITTI